MSTATATPELRSYQIEAIDAIRAAVARGVRRVLVELPTGTGKTLTFVRWANDDAITQGKRVLVLVHTDVLVNQTVESFDDVRVGVVKADRNEHDKQIVVA